MSSAPSRSNPDPVGAALDAACATVLAALADRSDVPAPVVLLDGRSGAGKSSLARALVRAWPGAMPVQLVPLDALYPGWDGLAEGGRIVSDEILTPRAEGRVGVFRRWDWQLDVPGEAQGVLPDLPLIIEGAGALTTAARDLVDIAVWVDAPAGPRRERALARDGEGYRPHWERWARQEDEHLRRHDPPAHADILVHVP